MPDPVRVVVLGVIAVIGVPLAALAGDLVAVGLLVAAATLVAVSEKSPR